MARSLKGGPFWVLEQQAGAGLMPGHSSQPRPGQLRLWSYEAAARGAELMVYFNWRTASCGQEMHWYGMLDSDGAPRRRFEELRRTIKELKERARLWEGWRPQADVAIVLDYDSAWALECTALGMRFDYFAHLRSLYGLLRQKGAQVDFVRPEQALKSYRVAVVPMPFLCTPEAAEQLAAYVKQGGRILVTAPAGYKTPVNTACAALPPGDLATLLGVQVIEHDVLRPGMSNAVVMGERRYATAGFCGVLELKGARALGAYEAEFYAGSPAVTVKQEGRGEAFYVGALGGPDLCGAVLDLVLRAAGARLCPWSSETVEVVPLTDSAGTGQMLFVLNHGGAPAVLKLPAGKRASDLFASAECAGEVRLDPYAVALLKLTD
jgi:beta-galactosidase